MFRAFLSSAAATAWRAKIRTGVGVDRFLSGERLGVRLGEDVGIDKDSIQQKSILLCDECAKPIYSFTEGRMFLRLRF